MTPKDIGKNEAQNGRGKSRHHRWRLLTNSCNPLPSGPRTSAFRPECAGRDYNGPRMNVDRRAGAEWLAFGSSNAEIALLKGRIGGQLRSCSAPYRSTLFDDVVVIGNVRELVDILIDQ